MDTYKQIEQNIKFKEKNLIKKRYNCIYLNDDRTSFDFVIDSLICIFNRTREDAEQIALYIHKNGRGIANANSLSKDIAFTKKDEVIKMARENGFPLKVIIEEV